MEFLQLFRFNISMRNIFIIFICIFFLNCSYKSPVLVDFDAPELTGVFYQGSDLLIQFNEPVKEFTIIMPDNFVITSSIISPVANNYLPQSLFAPYQSKTEVNEKASFSAMDTAGNVTSKEFTIPYINLNPADLAFSHVNLKYTKKQKQTIGLKTKNGGDLRGFTIQLFTNRFMKEIPFRPVKIKGNYAFEINVEYNKEVTASPVIHYNKNKFHTVLPNRIPNKCGLIVLYDYSGTLCDYIIYYDAKEKSLQEYQDSVYYKRLFSFVDDNISPVEYSIVPKNKCIIK